MRTITLIVCVSATTADHAANLESAKSLTSAQKEVRIEHNRLRPTLDIVGPNPMTIDFDEVRLREVARVGCGGGGGGALKAYTGLSQHES
jgi:hypothetical protein